MKGEFPRPDKTVIDYKPTDRNIGPAGDSFWKNTIHGWTAGGKPLDQAVNDAKTAAPGGTFGEVGVSKTHTVHGDTTQTYKDSFKAPPAKVEP